MQLFADDCEFERIKQLPKRQQFEAQMTREENKLKDTENRNRSKKEDAQQIPFVDSTKQNDFYDEGTFYIKFDFSRNREIWDLELKTNIQ